MCQLPVYAKITIPVKSVGCVTIDVYCSKENVIMRDCVCHILTSNLEIRISLIGTDDFIRKIEFFD